MTDGAVALRDAFAAGERSIVESTAETLRRCREVDGELGAFFALHEEPALRRARELEARSEPPGPLHGVPVAVKSNLCIAGQESNCGSRILAGYRPPYTATAVRRLEDAGAIVVGTTHMDELGMGSSGESSAFGRTVNPWDPERVPGGSSSGSAAAVAAGLVPLALGSDTGGSVRLPASFCGVAGFKPTYGRVSRYGLVAYGSSLDHVGPIARSVRDLERALEVLAGPDPRDATTSDEPAFRARAGTSLRGVRVGVPAELFPDDVDEGVAATVRAALDVLAERGARLVPLRLPRARYAVPAYYVVATAEASSNLARFDGVGFGPREPGDGSLSGMMAATREAGFGAEVKRRILLGTYALSAGYHDAWYRRALRVRARIAEDFQSAFEEVDVVAGPTSPVPAYRLGERSADPVAMYLTDVLTVPASLAGLPAVSVPCGLHPDPGARLPVGLQLIGPSGADERVLAVARAYEEARGPSDARPRIRA